MAFAFVLARVAAGTPQVAAHRRTDHEEHGRLEALLLRHLELALVRTDQEGVHEQVRDELPSDIRRELLHDVLGHHDRWMALFEPPTERADGGQIALDPRELLGESCRPHEVVDRHVRNETQ